MATLMDEVRVDGHETYGGYSGTLREWKGSWEGCRVTFHDNYDSKTMKDPLHCTDFFYHEKPPIKQSIDLITEVEEGLKVPPNERMKVYSANKPGAYCIDRGEFWSDPVRFTLLTILLRDAQKSLKTTLESFDTKYVAYTRPAVEAFTQGKTFYQTGSYPGWVMAFQGATGKQLENLLSDKPGNVEEVTVVHHPGFTKRQHKLSKK